MINSDMSIGCGARQNLNTKAHFEWAMFAVNSTTDLPRLNDIVGSAPRQRHDVEMTTL